MKKNLTLLMAIATLLFVACNRPVKGKNGVVYMDAITYNDYIINRQTEVMKLILKMSDEAQTNLDAAEQTLNTTITAIDKNTTEIEGMPDWKGDTTLRTNALALFRFYKTAFGNDFRRILAIQKDGEITTAEKAKYDELLAHINSEEGKLDANFQKAQQQFATQNKIPIQKNDIQDKIDQMGK